ncbi:uncharacterized protein LOC106641565 [Copidosoma floridanum]|uniref:uncharacterized protein LOC106641565 n=1 Tax=Copidosoma floridanum TaxID=29053 RepID=UPI000C6F9E8B|nr:uncharacterized protein LOC106641565 [Copidosoma floridanum]
MVWLARRWKTIERWRRRGWHENVACSRLWCGSNIGISTSSGSLMKVAIVGANSKTGRSLTLCLKQSGLIDELAVYDARPIRGLLHELSHTGRCRNARHDNAGNNRQYLERALRDAKVLLLASSRPRLNDEVADLRQLVPNIAKYCPKALVAVVSPSVNCLVPMLVELYKNTGGLLDERRLFGVLSLYSVRANSLAAETLGVAPEFVSVPVIGGACSKSCVPLFSRTRPCADFTPEELSKLMHAMRNSDNLVKSSAAYEENGDGSTDSSAWCLGFAAARFSISLCKALRDEQGIEECAYVRSCLLPEIKYCGERLVLGPSGIQKRLGVPRLTSQECTALYEAIPEIQKNIALGEVR